MLTRERFESIKHKNPNLNEYALLVVTVERLFKINDDQAGELKTCLKTIATLQKQLDWYRKTTIKGLT
jgi:hypothetical protein